MVQYVEITVYPFKIRNKILYKGPFRKITPKIKIKGFLIIFGCCDKSNIKYQISRLLFNNFVCWLTLYMVRNLNIYINCNDRLFSL